MSLRPVEAINLSCIAEFLSHNHPLCTPSQFSTILWATITISVIACLFFFSASNNPIVQLGVPRVGPFVFVWECVHPLQMMSEFQCEFMTVLWDCNEQRTVVALLSERILLICINGSFPFSISWIPKSVYCGSSLWHLLNFGPRRRWANSVFFCCCFF